MMIGTQAAERLLSHLVQRLELRELRGYGGRGPWLTLPGVRHGANRGHLRCFEGGGLDKLLFLLIEDGERLQGLVLAGFSPPDSAVPHFIVDAEPIARDYAFCMDLLPRVDLACNPEYVRAVYHPLTEAYEEFTRDPRAGLADVIRSKTPFGSPWARGLRCRLQDSQVMVDLTAGYLAHWMGLLRSQTALPVRGAFPTLAERDRQVRASLFSQHVDPMWEGMQQELGDVNVERVMKAMRTQGIAEID